MGDCYAIRPLNQDTSVMCLWNAYSHGLISESWTFPCIWCHLNSLGSGNRGAIPSRFPSKGPQLRFKFWYLPLSPWAWAHCLSRVQTVLWRAVRIKCGDMEESSDTLVCLQKALALPPIHCIEGTLQEPWAYICVWQSPYGPKIPLITPCQRLTWGRDAWLTE
jgi:hypothetical protein